MLHAQLGVGVHSAAQIRHAVAPEAFAHRSRNAGYEQRVDVDVILPCLDEAVALPWMLARLPAGARAIVFANGSTDGSAAITAALGATVTTSPGAVSEPPATRAWRRTPAPAVCFCDCDTSLDSRQLDLVLGPMRAARREELLGLGLTDRRFGYPLETAVSVLAR